MRLAVRPALTIALDLVGRPRECGRVTLDHAPVVGPSFFLDRVKLRDLALARRDAYRAAAPFPHAVFDDFLGAPIASALASRFPPPSHVGWMRRDYAEQSARLGQLQRTGFEGVDGALRHWLNELCGMAFVDFLSTLTGVDGLIADPHFRGAGLSATLPGGHLAVHADFNRDRSRHLERRLTVLHYLPVAWRDEWGGALELYADPPERCVARYAPVCDRLIVMDHGDRYWHGHPAPLMCPDGAFRATVGAYYYVATAPADDGDAHGAIWAKARRAD